MKCKFTNPHTNNELGLSQRLLEYYNLDLFDELDETKDEFFNDKISYFFSDVFRENFGDWVSEKLSNDRVDVDGAPLLNEVNGNLYVIDKNNEKYFINNRRFEGLEAYPAFRGNVAKLTSDAASMITKFIFDKYKNDTDDITDFSDLSFNLADEVDAFFDNQIELIPENEPVYDTFKDFNADFVEEVKDFLRSINLKYNELDDNDIDYQDGLEDKGTLIGKSSVERDSKDNASGNIRLMLSLLSNPESSSDYFYGKRMLPFGDVWNDVQNVLSNLPKLTADDGNVLNYLDVMKDRLNKMAYNKPYIKELLDVLESSNFNLQAQFFQSFGNLGKTSQDTLEVNTNNYAYRLINASQSDSKKANILTEAGIAFRDKFTTFNTETGEYTFDLATYGKFRSDYFGLTRGVDGGLSLIQELKKAFKDVRDSENPSQESIDRLQTKSSESSKVLYDLISSLGFNITPLSFEYLIRNNGEVPQVTERSLIDTLDRFMIGFNNIDSFLVSNKFKDEASQIDDATKKLFKNKTEYLNLFKGEKNSITGQKVIGDIAEAIGEFQSDNSDNMIMSGNKKIWAYSNTSHLFDVTSVLNKSPEEVKFRMSQPNNRHSVYLREISNGNLITIHRTNSMMEVDNTEAAVDNSNTSKNDAIVRDVVESLQGKKATSNSVYATPVPADKGSALKLGIKYFLDTAVRTVGDKVIVNGDTLDVFKGYMNDELSSGIAAKKFIDSNTNNKGEVDTSNLTQYYHVDGKGNTFDILNSSGVSIFQKGAFSDINRNNSNDINRFIEENESESYTMVYAGNAFRNFMIPSLSPEKLLSKPAEFGLFYNSDFTPIDIDINYSENNTETLTTKQIAYLNEVLTDKISDLINSTKASLIEKLLFNEDGSRNKFDTALYDVYKTELEGQSEIAILNQIASDYIVNNVIAQIEYSKIYNGSINMHKNGADYVKRVPKTYIDGKGLLLGITPKDHEAHIIVLQDVETSSPYIDQMGEVGKKFYGGNRINQADAQAYITPKRWKFLLERLGQFGKVEKAIYSKIEQMEAGKDVEFTKDELKHLSTKPLKGVYFDNENNSPTYLKYSQAVLLKSLVKGTPLEDLLNKMNDPSAPIDEAIMASGVKVGAQFSKDDVSQNLLSRTDFTPKRIKIDNRFWKLQQDLPNKGFKETLLGSQIQKNIFDNFNFDGDYEFNGKTMKGTEVYDNIHSAIGEISNRGLEKIKSRFGVSDDYTITNWGDFSKDIAQQLRDEKIDENIVKAVEKELTPYVVPQSRDKVMSTIMSILNKSTVKLKTNGGSLIQMSNFGLDQNLSEETGIRWIKDKKQLAEPRKFITPEGTTKVLPGQVFISGNLLSNYIPNWKSYTNEQLFGADGQGGMFPKEILQLITYRIPNQAMSSNDAMEIVGILPDTYIDTIVPYTGITTKTGSDFDIDKMFIMLPSLRGLHTYNTTVRNYVNDYLKGDNIPQTIENVQNFMYELQDNGLLFDINSLKEQLLKVDDPKTVVLTLLKEKTNEIIDIIKNIDNKNNPRVKAFKKNIGTTIYKVVYESYDDTKSLQEQSVGALQNRVFEAYHSILTHDGNYDNLITPIDHEHVKNFITKDLGLADTANLDFEAFSPLKQIDVKYKFIAGGFGIGQVANQLVDSISNQVSQEYIEENLGWGNKKAINGVLSTVFDMKSDNGYYSETITYKGKKSSYKISDTLTALLNGFVDIAKDSYITNGNWNTQTTNTGTFLIRAGVHPYKAMSFLAQPALVELIENIAEKEGITSKDKLSGNVLPELKAKYLDLLKGSLNLDEDQFQNLVNDINSTKYFTLPLGLESNKITSRSVDRLMDNIKGEKNTPQYYLDQYLSLVEYDTLKPKVKEFTKSVGASKYGENGVGKSIIGHLIQYNKTKDVIDKGYVKNFSQKFYNPEYIKDGYTSLGSYHKNTETFFRNLVQANPRMFITANNFFLNIMNDMVNETHNSKLYLDDENVGRTLETSLYTMIMSESKILKTQNSEFEYFFAKGSDTVPTLSNTVQKVKAQYLEAHKSNFFLENLSVKEEADLSFVGISNTISKSSDFSRKVTEGWKELSVDNPQLADDLVRYAYQQSGFRANNSQIYQYIPHEVFVRNNVNQYVTKVSSYVLDGKVKAETIKDNIYRHNWDNTKIVPKISYMLDQNNKLLDNDVVTKVYPASAGFRLSYDSNRHSQMVKDANIDKRFPRFMSANEKLYKLEGYVEVSEGIHEPVYLATHKLGYKSKAGQFHEYSMFREKANSNMISNNVNEQQQQVVDTLRELLKDAKFVPLNEVNDTVEPNVEVVEQEVDTVVIEEEVVDEESSETIQPSDITRKSELKQLFDADTSSPIVKGSVVNYKDKPWIVWNISDANRAQLIDTEGNKFSGTPDINKLQKVGDYRTTVYNGNDYIVSANENIYSLTTGKLVFTNKDKSTLSTKEKIISQIMNENDLEDPFNCKL